MKPQWVLWLGLSPCAALCACSDLPAPAIGQLELALSSGIGDAQFRLAKATFAVRGAAELTLESDSAPESDVIARALPAGQYSVELLEGWQLERFGTLGSGVVAAELASENPLAFGIAPGQVTTLTFQFRTTGLGTEGSSDGQLRIAIAVDGVSAPEILFTEIMKNPEALPDADGEWIELQNVGTAAVDLAGCTLFRDDQELALESGVSLEAGGFSTLANGDAPGFVPDVLYGGVTLPNTGTFTLGLRCGEQILDQVVFDAAELPNRAGRSLSLSSAALDDLSNDSLVNWCEGATPYNGDFGTPGAANPSCSP